MIAGIIHKYIKVAFLKGGVFWGIFFLILEKQIVNILIGSDEIFTVCDFVFFGVFN